MVEPDRPQRTIWRIYIACWISKSAYTRRICNTAFSRQRCLCERNPVLRYAYLLVSSSARLTNPSCDSHATRTRIMNLHLTQRKRKHEY